VNSLFPNPAAENPALLRQEWFHTTAAYIQQQVKNTSALVKNYPVFSKCLFPNVWRLRHHLAHGCWI